MTNGLYHSAVEALMLRNGLAGRFKVRLTTSPKTAAQLQPQNDFRDQGRKDLRLKRRFRKSGRQQISESISKLETACRHSTLEVAAASDLVQVSDARESRARPAKRRRGSVPLARNQDE